MNKVCREFYVCDTSYMMFHRNDCTWRFRRRRSPSLRQFGSFPWCVLLLSFHQRNGSLTHVSTRFNKNLDSLVQKHFSNYRRSSWDGRVIMVRSSDCEEAPAWAMVCLILRNRMQRNVHSSRQFHEISIWCLPRQPFCWVRTIRVNIHKCKDMIRVHRSVVMLEQTDHSWHQLTSEFPFAHSTFFLFPVFFLQLSEEYRNFRTVGTRTAAESKPSTWTLPWRQDKTSKCSK